MKIDARRPEGNAFAIMGAVCRLLEQSGRIREWDAVRKRMMEGDYRNLCAVAEDVTFGCIRVVNIDCDDDE